MTQEEKQEIIEELKDFIKEHLNIEVDSYYDPYSGHDDHLHKVRIYFD